MPPTPIITQLIIEASMVYKGIAWLGYGRQFRQAAANPDTQWCDTDTDLWYLAFTGAVERSRCMHCSSLSHKSYQYNWAPESTDTPRSPRLIANGLTLKVTLTFKALEFADPGTGIHTQGVHFQISA